MTHDREILLNAYNAFEVLPWPLPNIDCKCKLKFHARKVYVTWDNCRPTEEVSRRWSGFDSGVVDPGLLAELQA
jgi:hypothetical protein